MLLNAQLEYFCLLLDAPDGCLLEGGNEAHHLFGHPSLDCDTPLGRQALHEFKQTIGVDVERNEVFFSEYHLQIIL